ncbi:hypothetical protein Q3G72_029597 [Acer saccharum]|nr:hypothetical protein Q3G72_029597 [Acer saccharum]
MLTATGALLSGVPGHSRYDTCWTHHSTVHSIGLNFCVVRLDNLYGLKRKYNVDLHSSSISFFVPDLFVFGYNRVVALPVQRRSNGGFAKGLAASLKVSDALRLIDNICRVGVSPGEEIVSCAKCRYKYELVSGEIVSIDSEEISIDIPAWKRGLRFLQIMKQSIPAAVHSIVVQTLSGMACTHKFAIETVDLPQKKNEKGLPQFLSVAAVTSLAVGTTLNTDFSPVESTSLKDLKEVAEKEVHSHESFAEQMEQIMELENLEEKWRLQAEANNEAERLIDSQAMPTESV